jgi:hypothetical protein
MSAFSLLPVPWLSLAAAPTFAIMALAAAAPGGDGGHMMCTAEHPTTLGGMVPMYLLMSAFHSQPWLKLISRSRSVRKILLIER